MGTYVCHVLIWNLLMAVTEVISLEKSKSSIFDNKPIRVQDYGTPPVTSTIPLYDCSESHRSKIDIPSAFEVYHNKQWYLQSCQEGLIWNQTLCRCEFPNGNRFVVQCRDYRATGSEPTGKYEQIVNGQWIVRDCSLAVIGLVWDQEACQCVWGKNSKEMITGQGIAPCEIMLNMTFEDGVKDEAKNSFVEVGRGIPVPVYILNKRDASEGYKAAYFTDTALNIWYFAGNEIGSSLRVEFRFKMTNDPIQRDKYQIFLSNGCNVSAPGYTTPSLAIGYRAADQSYLLAFETANARKAIVCTRKLEAYDWHEISLIYEDGTLLFRVDDNPCIISHDFSGPVQKTPCPLTIGADPLERESMYKGYLDNIMIARYCRRFMDTEQNDLPDKKKGPMPVETAPNVVEYGIQQSRPSSSKESPLSKTGRIKPRTITSSKYFSEFPSSINSESEYSDKAIEANPFINNDGDFVTSKTSFRRSLKSDSNKNEFSEGENAEGWFKNEDNKQDTNTDKQDNNFDNSEDETAEEKDNGYIKNDKERQSVYDPKYSGKVGGQPSGSGKAGGQFSGSGKVGGQPSSSGKVGGQPSSSGKAGGQPSSSGKTGGQLSGSEKSRKNLESTDGYENVDKTRKQTNNDYSSENSEGSDNNYQILERRIGRDSDMTSSSQEDGIDSLSDNYPKKSELTGRDNYDKNGEYTNDNSESRKSKKTDNTNNDFTNSGKRRRHGIVLESSETRRVKDEDNSGRNNQYRKTKGDGDVVFVKSNNNDGLEKSGGKIDGTKGSRHTSYEDNVDNEEKSTKDSTNHGRSSNKDDMYNSGNKRKFESKNSEKGSSQFRNNGNDKTTSEHQAQQQGGGHDITKSNHGFIDDMSSSDLDEKNVDYFSPNKDGVEDLDNDEVINTKQSKQNQNRQRKETKSEQSVQSNNGKSKRSENGMSKDSDNEQNKRQQIGSNKAHNNQRNVGSDNDRNKVHNNRHNVGSDNDRNKVPENGHNNRHQNRQNGESKNERSKRHENGQGTKSKNGQKDEYQNNEYGQNKKHDNDAQNERFENAGKIRRFENWQAYRGVVQTKPVSSPSDTVGNEHNPKDESSIQFEVIKILDSPSDEDTKTKFTTKLTSDGQDTSDQSQVDDGSWKSNTNMDSLAQEDDETVDKNDLNSGSTNTFTKSDKQQSVDGSDLTESKNFILKSNNEIKSSLSGSAPNLVKGRRRFGSKKLNWYDKSDSTEGNQEISSNSDKLDNQDVTLPADKSAVEYDDKKGSDSDVEGGIDTGTQTNFDEDIDKSNTDKSNQDTSVSKNDQNEKQKHPQNELLPRQSNSEKESTRSSTKGYANNKDEENNKGDYTSQADDRSDDVIGAKPRHLSNVRTKRVKVETYMGLILGTTSKPLDKGFETTQKFTSATPTQNLTSGTTNQKMTSETSTAKLSSGTSAAKLSSGTSAPKLSTGTSASKLSSGTSASKLSTGTSAPSLSSDKLTNDSAHTNNTNVYANDDGGFHNQTKTNTTTSIIGTVNRKPVVDDVSTNHTDKPINVTNSRSIDLSRGTTLRTPAVSSSSQESGHFIAPDKSKN